MTLLSLTELTFWCQKASDLFHRSVSPFRLSPSLGWMRGVLNTPKHQSNIKLDQASQALANATWGHVGHVGKRRFCRMGGSTVLKVEEPAIVKQMRCLCSLQGDIAVINSRHLLGVVAMYCWKQYGFMQITFLTPFSLSQKIDQKVLAHLTSSPAILIRGIL